MFKVAIIWTMACLQCISSIDALLQVSLPDYKISCVDEQVIMWWIQEKFPEVDIKLVIM